jgi:hypothetical protein
MAAFLSLWYRQGSVAGRTSRTSSFRSLEAKSRVKLDSGIKEESGGLEHVGQRANKNRLGRHSIYALKWLGSTPAI